MIFPIRSVIAGDLGAIATALGRHLLDRGNDVAMLGATPPDEAEQEGLLRHHRFSFARCEGARREQTLDHLARADQVFLVSDSRRLPGDAAAALERLDLVARRTIDVLDACLEADATLVVVTSPQVPTQNSAARAHSDHTLQRFVTSSVNAYHRRYGLAVAHVRVPGITSGHRHGCIGRALPLFVQSALRGEDIHVPGDGTAQACLSCLHDIAPAVAAVADHGQSAATGYDLAFEAGSLLELARRVVRHTGSTSTVVVGSAVQSPPGWWAWDRTDLDDAIPHKALDALIESLSYGIRVAPRLDRLT